VDVRWTTAFIGLEYLLAVLLSTLLIARRLIKSKNATSGNALNRIFLLTSFLVILNPLVVTWSLEFIPQAYAVTLMLSILLLISVQKNSASAYIATLPLSFAMVLSHGGVTLWFIAFLSVWLLISLFSRKSEDAITRLIGKVLKTVTVVTLAYWIYTTVIEVIVWGSRDIWSLLIGLISGGAVSRSAGAIVPVPWYTVALGYFAFCVSCVFAFVGWSFCKEAAYLRRDVVNAIFLIGTMSVAVALIGNVFNPSLSLERYLGPSAFTILAILASVGLFAMYMRGIVGRAFVSLVVVTMVCGLVFGGFYTPDYAPLGQPAWLSQKAPPRYDEVKCLEHLSSTIKTNSILIDWRAGAVFEYYCIEKLLSEGNGILEFKERGVKISTGEVGIEVILIGSYGLTVGEKDVINYLNHENAIFVYRKSAFEKLGLLVGVDEGYLLSAVDVKEKVYDSGRIYVFAGN
jgi:hypothetical protein